MSVFESTEKETERIVRQAFRAYEIGDVDMLHELLADDFSFSAPPDPHLDKDGYMKRCWPFHEKKPCFKFDEFFIKKDHALVLYGCKHSGGSMLRNVEYYAVRDGMITQVTVFFGPELSAEDAAK